MYITNAILGTVARSKCSTHIAEARLTILDRLVIIRTAYLWSLSVGFCFSEIVLKYVTSFYVNISISLSAKEMLHPDKNGCHITPLPPHNGHFCTPNFFLCPQGGRFRGVLLYCLQKGSNRRGLSHSRFS